MKLIDEALKAKEEGLIKHISFSFHDKPENMKYIIDNGPELETVLLQYNLLDRGNEEMIDYAAEKGLGVLAMGPVAGGRLAAPTELYTKLTGKASIATYELALRFVLGNKNISCALSGMQDEDMLEKNLKVANIEEPMSEEEWQKIKLAMEEIKKFSELYCTGCRYCMPCPKNIDIPGIFNYYTYHNVYGLTKLAKDGYNDYIQKEGGTFKNCINCCYCESKCPQKLKIREELRRVERVLSDL